VSIFLARQSSACQSSAELPRYVRHRAQDQRPACAACQLPAGRQACRKGPSAALPPVSSRLGRPSPPAGRRACAVAAWASGPKALDQCPRWNRTGDWFKL
jgi:hypothetical protein